MILIDIFKNYKTQTWILTIYFLMNYMYISNIFLNNSLFDTYEIAYEVEGSELFFYALFMNLTSVFWNVANLFYLKKIGIKNSYLIFTITGFIGNILRF